MGGNYRSYPLKRPLLVDTEAGGFLVMMLLVVVGSGVLTAAALAFGLSALAGVSMASADGVASPDWERTVYYLLGCVVFGPIGIYSLWAAQRLHRKAQFKANLFLLLGLGLALLFSVLGLWILHVPLQELSSGRVGALIMSLALIGTALLSGFYIYRLQPGGKA